MSVDKIFYQHSSKNEKWIKTVVYMNERHMFYEEITTLLPLILYDESLQSVDPFDINLTDEEKHKILVECKKNPIYFMRECVKTTEGHYLRLNKAVIGVLTAIRHGFNIYLKIPYYDQYNFLLQVMAIILSMQHSSIHQIGIKNYEWDKDLVVMPDYFKDEFDYNVTELDLMETNYQSNVYLLNDSFLIENSVRFMENLSAKQTAYDNIIKYPVYICTSYDLDYSHGLNYQEYWCTDDGPSLKLISQSHILAKVQYDLIELEINIRDSFKLINEKIDNESKIQLNTLEHIKLFAKYILLKKYDKLDILEKLYINRIYADLSNGF